MSWQASQHLERALRPRGAKQRLAEALGKNQATVGRWARGTRPDPALWDEIERHLGLEPGTLTDDPVIQLRSAEYAELQGRLDRQATMIRRLSRQLAAVLVEQNLAAENELQGAGDGRRRPDGEIEGDL